MSIIKTISNTIGNLINLVNIIIFFMSIATVFCIWQYGFQGTEKILRKAKDDVSDFVKKPKFAKNDNFVKKEIEENKDFYSIIGFIVVLVVIVIILLSVIAGICRSCR